MSTPNNNNYARPDVGVVIANIEISDNDYYLVQSSDVQILSLCKIYDLKKNGINSITLKLHKQYN